MPNFLSSTCKAIFLVFFIVGMFFIFLKAKYDNLASDYLQSASKVGKYYALSCQQKEEECRQLLQRLIDSSAKTHWIERLYRDHLLQQHYNQVVLVSFEKEIALRKNGRPKDLKKNRVCNCHCTNEIPRLRRKQGIAKQEGDNTVTKRAE